MKKNSIHLHCSCNMTVTGHKNNTITGCIYTQQQIKFFGKTSLCNIFLQFTHTICVKSKCYMKRNWLSATLFSFSLSFVGGTIM